MSTSLSYHAFGVRGYESCSTEYSKGGMTMTIEQPRAALCCSQCGGRHVPAKGGVTREFRSLPIGGKPVRLRMTVPRVLCRTCFAQRQVTVAFADPKKSYTRSFARYAIELAARMTLSDVARHLQISWDVVKSIVGENLQRWFANTDHPSAKDPYFLYAASNLGSLLALVMYPLVVEPTLRLRIPSLGVGCWELEVGS